VKHCGKESVQSNLEKSKTGTNLVVHCETFLLRMMSYRGSKPALTNVSKVIDRSLDF